MESHFIKLRNQYLPKAPSVVFVLESPPVGHGFVYDPEGRVSEVLFRAFMRLIDANPSDKYEGLSLLSKKGWVLTNAIYTPVNKLSDKKADELILNNYQNFKSDLLEIVNSNLETPIILIKKNICKLLEPRLENDGFNVLNKGMMIPFPLHYHADDFKHKVLSLIPTN